MATNLQVGEGVGKNFKTYQSCPKDRWLFSGSFWAVILVDHGIILGNHLCDLRHTRHWKGDLATSNISTHLQSLHFPAFLAAGSACHSSFLGRFESCNSMILFELCITQGLWCQGPTPLWSASGPQLVGCSFAAAAAAGFTASFRAGAHTRAFGGNPGIHQRPLPASFCRGTMLKIGTSPQKYWTYLSLCEVSLMIFSFFGLMILYQSSTFWF